MMLASSLIWVAPRGSQHRGGLGSSAPRPIAGNATIPPVFFQTSHRSALLLFSNGEWEYNGESIHHPASDGLVSNNDGLSFLP